MSPQIHSAVPWIAFNSVDHKPRACSLAFSPNVHNSFLECYFDCQAAISGRVSPNENQGGVNIAVPETLSSSVTQFGIGEAGSTAFAYFISALRENDLLRILVDLLTLGDVGHELALAQQILQLRVLV